MTRRSKTHDRDKALKRALVLFWKQGYHATSLKDLERALGMHPGSIYSAFGSKEKLFRMALEHYANDLAKTRDETVEHAPSILDGLAQFVSGDHPIARDDLPVPACFLAKTMLDTGVDQPRIRDVLNGLLDQTETSFATMFRAAREAGELPETADPDALARRLQVSLTGIGFYALRGNRRETARDMANDLAREIRGLGGPAPAGLLA